RGGRGEPFDGGGGRSGALHCGDQARKDQIAVEDHGARAALAELAAVLGTGQAKVFARDFEERLVGLDHEIPGLAVDGEGEPQLLARRRGERDEIHCENKYPNTVPCGSTLTGAATCS